MISGKSVLALPRVLLLATLLAARLTGANAQEVTAEDGSIAIGGNVSNSIIGPTPEQLSAIIAAATDPLKKLTDEQQATITNLQRRLGASEAQVLMFFRIIGESDVPPEQVGNRLVEIAERYKNLLVEVERNPGDDPVVARLKTEAHAALEAGDFDRADALLGEVENAVLDRAALEAAAVRAQRGEIALTQLDYLRAAEHFEQASTLVPAEDNDRRGEYLRRYADALYRHGDERGDNIALVSAMDVYRQALEALPRARVPQQWAMTQNNLAVALSSLGERESGTARVQEAVEAFRAALQELTRERVPLDWAMTQTGLGTALARLGERTEDAEKLEEGREAIDAAFAVYMESGQEHYRAYFEDLLRAIDDSRARLQTTLKAR